MDRRAGIEVSFLLNIVGTPLCQGTVCIDATVGTFNKLLRDAGFHVPEGMTYIQDLRVLQASQTEVVIWPGAEQSQEVARGRRGMYTCPVRFLTVF